MHDPTADLPHAHGGPVGSASLKLSPEDFVVEEILGFEPSGEGEHVFLLIEKRGENTDYLAKQLARHAQVPVRDVSYAGLKDRHGLTRQWFSVQLPGKAEPDWSGLASASVRVLDVRRNARKLRRGAASGNRFALTLRGLEADAERLALRLRQLAAEGVPNYFGAQRFGHDGQNLARARELFAEPARPCDRHRRGLYLSAARSALFNRILAERVRRGDWNRAIDGDVFMFSGSQSFFGPEPLDEALWRRVEARAIHPSAVLWGETPSTAMGEALVVETAAVAPLEDLARGLEQAGLETARRPLRLCPEALTWSWPAPDVLHLAFTLPAGAYATTVVRELVATDRFDA